MKFLNKKCPQAAKQVWSVEKRLENGRFKERHLYLMLTQYCNQRCIYCYNGDESYEKKRKLKMNLRTAKKSVDAALNDLAPGGNLKLIFRGGEPLLAWQILKKIVEYCQKIDRGKSISFQITSNLTFLPLDLIGFAKRNKISFVVTVDGPSEIHDKTRPLANGQGSYALITNNVKKLTGSGIEVILRTVITKYNQGSLLETAKIHKELGVKKTSFMPLTPFDSDKKMFPETMFPSPRIVASGLKQLYKSKIWKTEELYPIYVYAKRLRNKSMEYKCYAHQGSRPCVDTQGNFFLCYLLLGNAQFGLKILPGNRLSFNRSLEKNAVKSLKKNQWAKCKKCSFFQYCNINDCFAKMMIANDSPPAVKKYVREMTCAIAKITIKELLSAGKNENISPCQ